LLFLFKKKNKKKQKSFFGRQYMDAVGCRRMDGGMLFIPFR
jgi:hypothetical protein